MDLQSHTTSAKLEEYAFYWSEARLVIAAFALFMGGIPPVLALNPIPSLFVTLTGLLNLCWIISGVVSGYLLYLWDKNGRKVFGGNEKKDVYAFFVNVVTGFNLGITGLVGVNIGMSITTNRFVFFLAGVVYLLIAWYLWKRWKERGKKFFA